MKIAVIFNRESRNVINLFGVRNREKYGKKSIARIVASLEKFGHQVRAFEGDKDLITNLEEFMPRVLKGELPGLAFNLSYGIQGQARYTHVPGILEMVGIPYVGSNPLAHSLALDKVVAKMIFRQHGLPTPDFAVLREPGFDEPELKYPLIVKPKNEAVSMGIRIVNNIKELREAAQVIFDHFNQPVLVEQYIDGKEINVGLLGNNPPEALPPCEITFGNTGPAIYTIEDKKGKSGRKIDWVCPAQLGDRLAEEAQKISRGAFEALGCYDMARVDLRMDKDGNLYILEVNSLPSLGEHGSYTIAAQHVGLDFPSLVNRMVEVASARYFGTPSLPVIQGKKRDSKQALFTFITQRRDQIEKSLQDWVSISSRTSDPVGNNLAVTRLDKRLREIQMEPAAELSDSRSIWTWQTKAGLEGGSLFIGHIDAPLDPNQPGQPFRRDPEWLYGEAIGISRAPLVSLLWSLRALRNSRMLSRSKIGVMYYLDEGRDTRYSAEIIQRAISKARRVFVLRPGGSGNEIFVQRRGIRKYRLVIDGSPQQVGKPTARKDTLLWTAARIQDLAKLTSRKNRIALAASKIDTDGYPLLLPHRVTVSLLMSYLDPRTADRTEVAIRDILKGNGFRVRLETVSDRPAMKERQANLRLANLLGRIAEEWEIPLPIQTSLWPSVGGYVSGRIPVVCGIGPAARNLHTPHESVSRTSLIQRTILIAEFLAREYRG